VTHASMVRRALGVAAGIAFVARGASAEPPGAEASVEPAKTSRTEQPESAGSIAERLVAEFMIGSGFATAGFIAGSKVVSAACSTCVFAAGFAGASATFPIGVYAGGRLVRGKGDFWLTIAAPWLVSATTIVALARDEDYDGRPAFEIGTIGGSIAAPLSMALFELSHAWARGRTPERTRATLPLPLHVGLSPARGSIGVVVAGTLL
jgi:hypothetical protein